LPICSAGTAVPLAFAYSIPNSDDDFPCSSYHCKTNSLKFLMNVLVETQETKGNNSNLADHQLGQCNYGNEVMRYSGHVLFPAAAIAKCAVSLSVGNKEQDCHSEDIKAHNGFMAMSNPSPSC
jgi:hypothetical protein